jgi:hypothetical protein
MHASELTDEELAALDAIEIPAAAARFNYEMPSASAALAREAPCQSQGSCLALKTPFIGAYN